MEEGLDLIRLWRVIAKRWYLLFFLPLLVAGVVYYQSQSTYTPVYNASATLMITRPASTTPAASSDIYLGRQMAATYQDIIRSRRILNLVATDEMIPYSADALRGMISVQSLGGGELIEVIVTDLDPVLASYIANIVSRVFMDQIGVIIRGAYVTILDEAPVPRGPSNPQHGRRNVIGAFMFGLIAAVGFAFAIDYVDRSIKEPEEAENLLGLPVMALVPQGESKKEFTVSGRSPQAEALRTLRTNIQFSSVDKPYKCILVTGANAGCGKSTIAANLAISFAQSGGEVLLVDSDLRRPSQQRFFKIESAFGLSNLIFENNLDFTNVILDSGKIGLKILLSGPIPPYPAELLSSQRMTELVVKLQKKFDYIVFDSPPLLAMSDAVVLSKLVDGTLIVLDYGRVRRDEAIDAVKTLHRVQANVIGTVLNNVPYSQKYYDGYKSYYGAGSKSDQQM